MTQQTLVILLTLFLSLVCFSETRNPPRSIKQDLLWSVKHSALPTEDLTTVLRLRAGSQDDSESEDISSEDEGGNSLLNEPDMGNVADDGLVGTLVNSAWKAAKVLVRATLAAFDFSEVKDDASVLDHIALAAKRMWKAAFSSKSSLPTSKSYPDIETSPLADVANGATILDFGSYLGHSYGVDAGREVLDDVEPILTGSFQDALREARSQARLLVVLIPSQLPKKKDKGDLAAIESFLSESVATVARKKAKKGATTGSFVLWSAKATSPEAAVAIKRLKAQTTNAKGNKRPILLVVYPNQIPDNLGRLKMVPRLLAQHHCSPPPSADTMAAWLNALRKRHVKQYTAMQTELKELELFQERKEGYKESVKADIENKKRQAREAAERKAREEAEKKRAEEIRQRRESIRANLPEEPDKSDKGARVIALRFSDGRSAQRRFPSDASLETVFGWIDVAFEVEQETITLTTMNGKLSFTWEDRETTLEESGLPIMAGLRVTFCETEDGEPAVSQ